MLTSPESYDGTPLPSAYRSDLNAIGHSAQHLLALVDDVLDMARIGAGRIPLAHDLVDPHVLIDEATATMRDYIATKGLALHVEVQPGLPALWIDRVRIRQVLLNLLVNATRFTDQGSIRVRVHREADELIVAVEDTGRGIPEADLPRIFEAFRSTEQPLSTWHSGTGLGLPISKQFVELHGGRIGVESTSGRGTTFWFTLPAQAVPDPQRRPRRWNPTVHLTTSERIVLVVHDEPAIATLLKRYLEGCRVIHVPGWKAALALAEEVQAIAIVVDTSMDVPDGDSSVPVIRCPLPSGRRAALALGAEDFLVKPVTRATLLAAIDRFETPIHRVLIADDNPKVVRLFRRMLRQHPTIDGVEEAFNGQEALQLMRAEQPDLLLLDLAMPVVDGLDVLEAMAADPDLREIPTIIVSANGYGNDWETTGVLSLWQPTGFQMDDTMRALNALLGTLAPAWRQLESMESGSQAVPAA
jgi:CheY-like chemotaxis protein